jgi:2-amino-4-hydroxy-6-hydroxymethyldihydropteridine diphosphokinase
MADIFLALGGNMGDRKQNLKQALVLLSRKVDIEAVSPIYESDPVGYTEQPLFLNLVLKGKTTLKSCLNTPRKSRANWAGSRVSLTPRGQ